MDKEQFMVQAVLFVNLSGEQVQVDTSTLVGVVHTQPFIQHHYIEIIAAVFGVIIALFLIVVTIRIIYPAYKIKRGKLREERKRMERRKP